MPSTEESPNVCIIGAGISGICAAIQLQRLLNIKTFTIYDNQDDVGGVWRANRYPGCGNDIPSILFTYSFALKGDFSNSYVPTDETCSYLKDLAVKYDLYSRMQFRTEVKALIWNENLKKWKVTVGAKGENEIQTINYDIVISGIGHFHKPHYPPEFMGFKGTLVHTANWDPALNLENLDVAVIGSGATAIQLIPNIVDQVKTLYSFQRKPIWNFSFLRPVFKISRPAKFVLCYFPFAALFVKALLFLCFELFTMVFRTDWNVGQKCQTILVKLMKRNIPDNEKLLADLTPDYPVGCKRFGFHNDYFSAIQKPNVKLIKDPIAKVVDNGIITENGTVTKVDVLVLATGFQVQKYFAPLEIIGRGGANILEKWQNEGPSTYFGITSSNMPNLFMLNGPASDSGHVPTTFIVETQVKMATSILAEMIKRKSTCFSIKEKAEEKFMKDLNHWFKNTVQGVANCGSYYKNSKNNITMLWPLSGTELWLKTRSVNFSNFEFN